MYFYSPSTAGFYVAEIHGAPTLKVPDPAWIRPRISVTLQHGEEYRVDGGGVVTNTTDTSLALESVPDWSAEAPMVEQPNPDTLMPSDVVPVSDERHADLMAVQRSGRVIVPGDGGQPIDVAADVAIPHAELVARARAAVRLQRSPVISVLDGLQGTAASKGLAALLAGDSGSAVAYSTTAAQIEALKQALKDAPTLIDFASCATFDDMRTAAKAYYAGLVSGAPADVVTAFREVV